MLVQCPLAVNASAVAVRSEYIYIIYFFKFLGAFNFKQCPVLEIIERQTHTQIPVFG